MFDLASAGMEFPNLESRFPKKRRGEQVTKRRRQVLVQILVKKSKNKEIKKYFY